MKNKTQNSGVQLKEPPRITVRVSLDEISKSSLSKNQRRDMIEGAEKDFKLLHRLGMLR